MIILGDALEGLRTMPDDSVDCCVTSPPYFGLRDYGVAGQMGLEPTPEAFVEALVQVMREVRRVLKSTGTLWLNLGDSYARNGGAGECGPNAQVGSTKRGVQERNTKAPDGLKPKDLVGIPWRVAFALQSDGWYLRQDIIWAKSNPMPESVTDRCTKAHEYLFLLAKSERYFFDNEAIKEPAVRGAAGSNFHTGKTGEHQMGRASTKPRKAGNKTHKYVTAYNAADTEEHRTKAGLLKVAEVEWETRNRRDVWSIPTKPFKGAHFAVMPEALVEPCILAGCPAGGLVLDPFTGSGTVGAVAVRLGRNFVGTELNPDYANMAERRINAAIAEVIFS